MDDEPTIVMTTCPTERTPGCECPFCSPPRAHRPTGPQLGPEYLEKIYAEGDRRLRRLTEDLTKERS
jgi:hypothetical protein